MVAYKFKVGDEEFEFLTENFEIKEHTQLAYSQAYGFYLKNGVMTKAQALELGKKNDVMDKDWDQKVQMLMMKLITDTAKLADEKKKKKPSRVTIQRLKDTLRKTRSDYEKTISRQNDLIQATCENLAENRAIEYAVVLRLVDHNGNLVFKDHEDLVSRYNDPVVAEAVNHMLYLKYGLPYNLEGLHPEDEPDEEEAPIKAAIKK